MSVALTLSVTKPSSALLRGHGRGVGTGLSPSSQEGVSQPDAEREGPGHNVSQQPEEPERQCVQTPPQGFVLRSSSISSCY